MLSLVNRSPLARKTSAIPNQQDHMFLFELVELVEVVEVVEKL